MVSVGLVPLLLFVAYVTLAAVNSWAGWMHRENLARITKPFLLPLLIVAYCLLPRQGRPFNWLFLIALAGGWVGDLTVQKPRIEVSAFLAEHLILIFLYIRNIRLVGQKPEISIVVMTVCTLVLVCGLCLLRLIPRAGRYFTLIVIYGLGLMSMVACALIWMTIDMRPETYAIALGSVLFLISDITLSKRILQEWLSTSCQETVLEKPRGARLPDDGAGLAMGCYTAAQLLLTLGIGGVFR